MDFDVTVTAREKVPFVDEMDGIFGSASAPNRRSRPAPRRRLLDALTHIRRQLDAFRNRSRPPGTRKPVRHIERTLGPMR
jgi:hypothetical protein